MKGIILAGGTGSRLYPITQAVCKQLMPIYDKPMIYYPLSTLILSGIREIAIITTPHDKTAFKNLLKDGSQLGCSFEYIEQKEPEGIAQAFVLTKDFIGLDSVCLILGDNIFYGGSIHELTKKCHQLDGGIIFSYKVKDPQRYGVVEVDNNGLAISIEEKPTKPKSKSAVAGLYFYDNEVVKIAKNVQKSTRGEYEITDINSYYLNQKKLKVIEMEKNTTWLDTGTIDSLFFAYNFIKNIEQRNSQKIGCIEEAAFEMGYIDETELTKLAKPLMKSGYGQYLLDLI
ncbi:glucose-1-phosphate thymidylyltransferase RfbA [Candidatus Gracilibacteria bacterium]|nr:glucose-1-phosphate thymidylyltransferase RfbA [Candidatus Gracilibacteria bacterium]